MKRRNHIITLVIMVAAFFFAAETGVRAQTISEIEIDPPSTTSDACQFVEIRGVPASLVQANTYFVSVNSDAGNFGFANQAVGIGGLTVGANGTITLFNTSFGECPNRTYGTGTTRVNYFSPLRVGSGSETYLLVRSPGVLFAGQDLDSNDDGIFDPSLAINVVDGFALLVNPEEEYVYGAAAGVVNISNTTSLDQPDAVTRFGGNPSPFSSAAFYFGELAATPDETVAYEAPLSPNFPAGAVLTPGDANGPASTNTVQFSSAIYTQDESQSATVTVTRTGTTTGTLTVTAVASNGTASGGATCGGSGVDFITLSQPLTFGPGVTTQTFDVVLCSDTISEGLETVNVSLINPAGGGVGSQATAVVNINSTASQFRSTVPITTINGAAATPYPSTIVVSGGIASIASMRVTLYDLSHTFPDNFDILLVGPGGQKFVLMGDAGGPLPISDSSPVTLTFSDFAGTVLPNTGPLTTGTFEPTTWETPVTTFPAPAPAGPYSEPGSSVGGTGVQTLIGNFGGTTSNGTWSLYVRDDGGLARPSVITGMINGGWGLEFLGPTAAGVDVSGRVLTPDGRGLRNTAVSLTDSNGQRRTVTTGSFGYYRFSDVEAGQTYVVGVQSKRFRFSSRIVQVVDSLNDVDFVAEQ